MNNNLNNPQKKIKKPKYKGPSDEYIQQCVKEGYIHHYDFEFNTEGRNIYPIELGISTYTMDSSQEIDSLHLIINSKPPKPFPSYNIKTHGLTISIVYSASSDYFQMCQQILSYLEKFNDKPSVWVLKEESVSGDKDCLDWMFEKAGLQNNLMYKNIQHITHHKLLTQWMEVNEINIEYQNTVVNSLYKNIPRMKEKKCYQHQSLKIKYHCALEDARNTAIAVYTVMNSYKENSVPMQQQTENIPTSTNVFSSNTIDIPTSTKDFSLNTKAVIFHAEGYQFSQPRKGKLYGQLREVCCSVIDLQTSTIEKRQSFFFSTTDNTPLKDEKDKQAILDEFMKNELTNGVSSKQIVSLLDNVSQNNNIIIVGKESDLKKITNFPMKQYSIFSHEEFIVQLQNKLTEFYHLEKSHINLFDQMKEDFEIDDKNECYLHNDYQLESQCAVEVNYKFIGFVQYFIHEFKSIHEMYKGIQEESISPISSNSPSPAISPDVSPSTSPRKAKSRSRSNSPRNKNNVSNNSIPQPIPSANYDSSIPTSYGNQPPIYSMMQPHPINLN